MPLAPGDRTKLVRVLGLLGSDQVGERAAAGWAAHKLIAGHGLGWDDVLAGSGSSPRPEPEPSYPPPTRAFADDARACLRHPELFSHWECGFLSSIACRRRLSVKQLAILASLVERLRAQGQYPG